MAPYTMRLAARGGGCMELIIHCKETAVSNLNATTEQTAKTQKVELLDCGQASKTTKGFPFFLLIEISVPPFDRQLIL